MPRHEALTLTLARGSVDLAPAAQGEIEVEVAATGLNRADLLQQRGHYPAPPGVPQDVLGLEYAGTVVARGEGATQHAIGDRVMGIVGGGAFARRVVVHEREALPIPTRLSFAEAAAVPEAFITAHDALFTRAQVQKGDRVLIHAAASGVGTAAIQLARRVGATVVGTTRGAAKADVIRGLGAEAVVVEDGKFADQVRPVDVIIDLVGAVYFAENLASIAILGRWVVLGLVGGGTVELPLGALLSQRITLVGSVLRARTRTEKIAASEAFQRDCGAALADGLLRPIVDEVFPIDSAAKAFRRMAENATIGKLVLEW